MSQANCIFLTEDQKRTIHNNLDPKTDLNTVMTILQVLYDNPTASIDSKGIINSEKDLGAMPIQILVTKYGVSFEELSKNEEFQNLYFAEKRIRSKVTELFRQTIGTNDNVQQQSQTAEEWSKKEGWSVEHYNTVVKPEVQKGEAWQLEYELIDDQTTEFKNAGYMSYSYDRGGGKRSDVKSNSTIEAIRNGERTATTRYAKDGNLEYWKSLPVGTIITFYNGNKANKDFVNVKITKQATQLVDPSVQQSQSTTINKEGATEFNKLPMYTGNTMTYAGIGSRKQTPPEVKAKMTEVAQYLETLGYTLNTGTVPWNDDGADQAFAKGTNHKNLFGPNDATEQTLKIAEEIHPNWAALDTPNKRNLQARNTFQIFGRNLDTPVDFVLYYAQPSTNPIRPQGGTGQAVEMANRKGIPTINMMDPNWKDQLKAVLNTKKLIDTSNETSLPIIQAIQDEGVEVFMKDKNQTYKVVDDKIYNKKGEEIYVKESADRNKILANADVKQGKAVVVSHKDKQYVVNVSKSQIVSVTSGKIMQWSKNHGDRVAIMFDAEQKYHKLHETDNFYKITDDVVKYIPIPRGTEIIEVQGKRYLGVKIDDYFTKIYAYDGNLYVSGFWQGKESAELNWEKITPDNSLEQEIIINYFKAISSIELIKDGMASIGKNGEVKYNLTKTTNQPVQSTSSTNIQQEDNFNRNEANKLSKAFQINGNTFTLNIPNLGTATITYNGINIKTDTTGSYTVNVNGYTRPAITFNETNGSADKYTAFVQAVESVYRDFASTALDLEDTAKAKAEQIKSMHLNAHLDFTPSFIEMDASEIAFTVGERQEAVNCIVNGFEGLVRMYVDKSINAVNKKAFEIIQKQKDGKVHRIQSKEDYLKDLKDKNEKTITKLNRLTKELTSLDPTSVDYNKDREDLTKLIENTRKAISPIDFRSAVQRIGIDNILNKVKNDLFVNNTKIRNTELATKVVKYFPALVDDVVAQVCRDENLNMYSLDSKDFNEVYDSNSDDSENRDVQVQNDSLDEEETGYKESYGVDVRTRSNMETMPNMIRRSLERIKMVDPNGNIQIDSFGQARYVGKHTVNNVLNSYLKDMIDSRDMVHILKGIKKQYPWIEQILKRIDPNRKQTYDDDYTNAFYRTYKRYFQSFGVVLLNSDPSGDRLKIINEVEKADTIISQVRHNFESGKYLNKSKQYSIYNTDQTLRTSAEKGQSEFYTTLQKLLNRIVVKDSNTQRSFNLTDILNSKVDDNVYKLKTVKDLLLFSLKAVGIELPLGVTLQDAITANTSDVPSTWYDYQQEQEVNYTEEQREDLWNDETSKQIIDIKGALSGIFSSVSTYKGENENVDILDMYRSYYHRLANNLGIVTENTIASSSREGDKTYYSHTLPCYFSDLIQHLHRSANKGNKYYEDWMNENYKQFDFFYNADTNQYRTKWLELINRPTKEGEKNPYADAIKHITILKLRSDDHNDAVDYTQWDKNDIDRVMLQMYNNPVDKVDGIAGEADEQLAYYKLPLFSDSPACDFISFVKYVGESGMNKLLNNYVDLVLQEISRMRTVSDRLKLRLTGNAINTIASYDATGDANELKSLGGLVFRFLPALNYVKVNVNIFGNKYLNTIKDTVKESIEDFANGRENVSFAEAVEYLTANATQDTIREFIAENIEEVLDERIISQINAWHKHGIKKPHLYYYDEDGDRHLAVDSDDIYKAAKEYVWNTMFASAQLIQLTTTDLAFYGKIEAKKLDAEDLRNEDGSYKSDLDYDFAWVSPKGEKQFYQITSDNTVEVFQKRFKEAHAPSEKMNLYSKHYGQRKEKTVYLADSIVTSKTYSEIASVIDKQDSLSEEEKEYIKSLYRGINVADAQSLRTLKSYMRVLGMLGDEQAKQLRTAVDRLRSGKWELSDFEFVFQTLKPYVYTRIPMSSKVKTPNGAEVNLSIPTQHKNSEYVLLAMHPLICGALGNSSKLVALNKWMEDREIDTVQFESTTKVGKMGVIDINHKPASTYVFTQLDEDGDEYKLVESNEYSGKKGYKAQLDSLLESGMISQDIYDSAINKYEFTEKELVNYLNDMTNNGTNPEIIHEIPYEHYGIQTATPEHIIDKIQLVGSQIRKLIPADMPNDVEITINGVTFNKQGWWKKYNDIITENIIESFMEVSSEFKDGPSISKLIQEEVANNPRYSKDFANACKWNEKEQRFNIPLYDQVMSERIENLLNSVIKSRITKQKIKGGACIQVSDYGLTDKCRVLFKDANGIEFDQKSWLKNNPGASINDYNEWKNNALAAGDISIAAFEVMLPATSREMFDTIRQRFSHNMRTVEELLADETIQKELLEAVGYRVPTEAKYSMAPLRVVGFLPQHTGSAIMLPTEITTIAGSDFDVDKLYIMLYEFQTKHMFDTDKIISDHENSLKDNTFNLLPKFDEDVQKRVNKIIADNLTYKPESFKIKIPVDDFNYFKSKGDNVAEDVKIYLKSFKRWFRTAMKDYEEKVQFEKIQFDFNKDAHGQSREARNNGMIDMMRSVLTSPYATFDILNPGGFDKLKRAAKISAILTESTPEQLMKLTNTKKISDALNVLLNADTDQVVKYMRNIRKNVDPLCMETQTELHHQNMAGGDSVGIFANYNVLHALLEYCGFRVNDRHLITLNGRTLNRLGQTYTHGRKEGNKISKVGASGLAASVDNGKDPNLGDANLTTDSIPYTSYLTELGYEEEEWIAWASQPELKDLFGMPVYKIRKLYFQFLKDYPQFKTSTGEPYHITKLKLITKIELIKAGLRIEDFENLSLKLLYYNMNRPKNHRGKEFSLLMQYYLLNSIVKIAPAVELLSTTVQACKADTQNGGAGPTNIDSIVKKRLVNKFVEEMSVVDKRNAIFISDSKVQRLPIDLRLTDNNIDITDPDNYETVKNQIMSSPIPFLQAFYVFGVSGTETLMKKYFIHYHPEVSKMLEQVREYCPRHQLNTRIGRKFVNDLQRYILSSTKTFGSEVVDGVTVTQADKRNWYINNFPQLFYSEFLEKIQHADFITDDTEREKFQDYRKIEFLNALQVRKIGASNQYEISLNTVGKLTDDLRTKYEKDFITFFVKEPQWAMRLIVYGGFYHGFGWTNKSFMSLIPYQIRKQIPEYVDTLYYALDSKNNFDFKPMLTQFISNNANILNFSDIDYQSGDLPTEDNPFALFSAVGLRRVKEGTIVTLTSNSKDKTLYYVDSVTADEANTYQFHYKLRLFPQFSEECYQYGTKVSQMVSSYSNIVKTSTENTDNSEEEYDNYENEEDLNSTVDPTKEDLSQFSTSQQAIAETSTIC